MTRHTRRRVLALAGTGIAASLAGCASIVNDAGDGSQTTTRTTNGTSTRTTAESTGTTETTETTETNGETTTTEDVDVDISEPDVFSSSVPLPSNPSNHKYAVMGRPEETPTATVYGSWKCPFTRAFVLEQLPELVSEYVADGRVAIEFRATAYSGDEPFLGPDAPRATRAGLAAWNVDPSSYWSYFAYVFANQPPEDVAWAQPDVLGRFATQAGVEPVAQFESGFTGSEYESVVRETADSFQSQGLRAVPRVVADGNVTAPTVDAEATRSQFERLSTGGSDD